MTSADIVISSGGVSVGEFDYVEQILTELGAIIHIQSVNMKPGKPLTFATHNSTLYFGLPGNPAAVLVTFWRFVQPTIKKLSGMTTGWDVKLVKAIAHSQLRSDGKRETYLWGKLDLVQGIHVFSLPDGSQSSGNLINLAQTNALAILPVGKTLISVEEEVEVLQLN